MRRTVVNRTTPWVKRTVRPVIGGIELATALQHIAVGLLALTNYRRYDAVYVGGSVWARGMKVYKKTGHPGPAESSLVTFREYPHEGTKTRRLMLRGNYGIHGIHER